MQHLVADAIAAGADTIDADALDKQVALYRCAAQIGITLWGSRSRPGDCNLNGVTLRRERHQ